ncbi:putative Pyridoxamine 5'-phosphate oxidase [Fusarium oxysporum f. sp. albedinis]|nr:putative Pyridoxamine 5'-phosphate oxidase [Fusarium oxysporum f. sp. albedinis]
MSEKSNCMTYHFQDNGWQGHGINKSMHAPQCEPATVGPKHPPLSTLCFLLACCKLDIFKRGVILKNGIDGLEFRSNKKAGVFNKNRCASPKQKSALDVDVNGMDRFHGLPDDRESSASRKQETSATHSSLHARLILASEVHPIYLHDYLPRRELQLDEPF